MTGKAPFKRYRPREIRARRWIEQRLEKLGETALRVGFDDLARSIARPLEMAADVRPRPAIVALSGGIRSTGELNATSQARLRYAAKLFERNPSAIFVVSGGPRRPGRPVSAPAMAGLARECGVPAEAILEEARSSRTAENAAEVAHLLLERGIHSATLVTSPLHMRRARLCFERHGISVGPAPVPKIDGEPPARRSLLAQSLHEWIGLFYYRATRRL